VFQPKNILPTDQLHSPPRVLARLCTESKKTPSRTKSEKTPPFLASNAPTAQLCTRLSSVKKPPIWQRPSALALVHWSMPLCLPGSKVWLEIPPNQHRRNDVRLNGCAADPVIGSKQLHNGELPSRGRPTQLCHQELHVREQTPMQSPSEFFSTDVPFQRRSLAFARH
jgi:hypothetical protein